jgi:hypothetical protein
MADIVMTSAPYCYGPTSKLISVAEDLAHTHRVTYVGMEPGLSLASKAPFVHTIQIKDRDYWNTTARRALGKASCFVTFLDYRSLKIAAEHGIPSIFFDTLLWLRTEPPPFSDLADLYLAQAYFRPPPASCTQRLSRFLPVGPVFSKQLDQLSGATIDPKERRILVHFGGLRSPTMRPNADRVYVSWIASILRLARIDKSSLSMCLPIYMADEAASISALLPKARVLCPGTSDFHACLSSATTLVTVPGLEAVYEAMYSGVPLVFLPPYNGTQVMQMRDYEQLGIAHACLTPPHLSGINPETHDTNRLTAEVQQLNELAAPDINLRQTFAHELESALLQTSAEQARLEALVGGNRRLIHQLGTDGRQLTVHTIESRVDGPARGPHGPAPVHRD